MGRQSARYIKATTQEIDEMLPTIRESEEGAEKNMPPEKGNDRRDGARRSRAPRKRTKTGCLTCRRRRIKCSEERPGCGNCIKSKRQCEGYNQRVIFKDPLNTWGGPARSGALNLPSSVKRAATSAIPTESPSSSFDQPHTQMPLQVNALKGDANCDLVGSEYLRQPDTRVAKASEIDDSRYERRRNRNSHDEADLPFKGSLENLNLQYSTSTDTKEYFGSRNDSTGIMRHKSNPIFASKEDEKIVDSLEQHSHRVWTPNYSEQSSRSDNRQTASELLLQSFQSSPNWSTFLAHDTTLNAKHTLQAAVHDMLDDKNQADDHRSHHIWPHNADNELRPDLQLPLSSGSVQMEHVFRGQISGMLETTRDKGPKLNVSDGLATSHDHQRPQAQTDDGAFEDSGGGIDYKKYDHDSETSHRKAQQEHLKNNDLGIIIALQSKQHGQEQRLRTYRSVIDSYGPGMLTGYLPSTESSPLKNSTTARIFCHFINVTGPAISMYERHPANSSLMFQGRPISRSQQHIWAYTFPTLALGNQTLLHAMLALSSLHIAKLQPNAPIEPAIKHYKIALREAGKLISPHSRRRCQPEMLAASLLMGIYELWCAEQQKWSNHLLRTKDILKEINFKEIVSFIKVSNKKQGMHQQQGHSSNRMTDPVSTFYYLPQSHDAGSLPDSEVDENIISIITGRPSMYDQYKPISGHIVASSSQEDEYTLQNVEIYETQRDLFWWYCKQDAYQSVMSGNKLFLDYEHWCHCLPRAPLGRLDAIYGTFDHLILLLGRVAEFVAKDSRRKRLILKINCGRWRTNQGTHIIGTGIPSGQESSPTHPLEPQLGLEPVNQTSTLMRQGVEGKALLPQYVDPSKGTSTKSTHANGTRCTVQTIAAEEEWYEIFTACKLFENNLSSEFQALGPDHSQPIQSPFGPALQYRTYSIAGIWIVYNLTLIMLHRGHPSMHPATMVAASVAAEQTSSYANDVGRAIAGITPQNISCLSEVNTQVGAGLIESSFGLFVAAIQYHDSSQRHWTIQRLMDINRLTGWQTSVAIANGCETSWIKTADMGRGPAYTRVAKGEKADPTMRHYGQRRIDIALLNRSDDAQKLWVSKQEKVKYCLGLLSLEDDFDQIELEE